MVYFLAVTSNADKTLLSLKSVKVSFPLYGGMFSRQIATVRAVEDISLSVQKGEVLGIVGESGCGKTTTGRAITRLVEIESGSILFDGIDLAKLNQDDFRPFRKRIQMVFQDPYGSLDPRMTVEGILEEPLIVHSKGNRGKRKRIIESWLEPLGLTHKQLDRYPHEFSGGQRQRIAIARSLILQPEVVIADEPVSALDVSIQAQVLNFLQDLAQDMGLTMIFIAHDISVVQHIADRMAVMYLGRIVELAPSDKLMNSPRHPYTLSLISSIPQARPKRSKDKKRILLPGELPSTITPPSGCPLHPRCPAAKEVCKIEVPPLAVLEEDTTSSSSIDRAKMHYVACYRNEVAVDIVREWHQERK